MPLLLSHPPCITEKNIAIKSAAAEDSLRLSSEKQPPPSGSG
ncbi:Uncharacterized protein dnm_077780 [Desulfonema magnum]|uniref:Uncharacterized protein n=1 Tax=Desulfonema magnum TaxID=45655 RepID=A0A975BUZ3_9BACT|nr:Uncharacterized protein dnm_077780 [Desulfonema magnum]